MLKKRNIALLITLGGGGLLLALLLLPHFSGIFAHFVQKVHDQLPLRLLEIALFCAMFCVFVYKNVVTLSDNIINFLKVLATIMVFCLHTSITTYNFGNPFSSPYMFFLRMPAWGAVWIFFFLSGFLAQRGFFLNNYDAHSLYGVACYYKKKFMTILLPTIIFMFTCTYLAWPSFFRENPGFFIKILTVSYNAIPGVASTSACWYIFALCGLFFISPIISRIIEGRSRRFLLCFAIFVCVAQVFYRYIGLKLQWNWHIYIFTPFWCSIDMFASGMVTYNLAATKKESPTFTKHFYPQGFFIMLLLMFTLYNSLTYFSELYAHQLIYPTVYCVLLMLILSSYQEKRKEDIPNNVKSNALEKFINFGAKISFAYYLIHSVILVKLPDVLPATLMFKNIYALHIEFIVLGFIISVFFAIGMTVLMGRLSGKKSSKDTELNAMHTAIDKAICELKKVQI